MLKDFLVCVSLANLCFISTWYQLQKLSSEKLYYFRKAPPDFTPTVATALLVLALGTLGLLFATALRRTGGTAARRTGFAMFALACIVPLEGVRSYFAGSSVGYLLLGGELVAAAIAVAALIGRRSPARLAVSAVLVFWPLFPLIVGHLAFKRMSAGSFVDQQSADSTPRPRASRTRAVWLIFDELDQQFIFEQRPAHLRLENLDRLRSTSLYAPRVVSAGPRTLISIPALTTGQAVKDADADGPGDLVLTLQKEYRQSSWQSLPSLFSKAREMGLRVGIAGWYHPYCRVAGAYTAACSWEEFASLASKYPWESRFRSAGLLGTAVSIWQRQLGGYPVLVKLGLSTPVSGWKLSDDEYVREATRGAFDRIRNNALKMITDPAMDLVFVHWPIPHPPGLSASAPASTTSGYIDNLELTDRTLGEVWTALRESNLWDRTLLLVTSDHGFRSAAWKKGSSWTEEDTAAAGVARQGSVPFLLKLPQQVEGLVYNSPVNATVSADLTLAALSGELNTAAEASRWLDIAHSPKN